MAENSTIGWTDHTANFWWGCTKVHAGCKHCYAETWDKRYGGGHWGDTSRRAIKGVWADIEKWNRDAIATFGRAARVFACSMCDIYEEFFGPVRDARGNLRDGVTIRSLRERAHEIIPRMANLRFQVLTKRPQNIVKMVPKHWLNSWPSNVITGTSPCDQETADKYIPLIRDVPGPHFLSCEPLIGPIKFKSLVGIDWVIIGGESGGGLRQLKTDWIESIVDQCDQAGVACFVKQDSSFHPGQRGRLSDRLWNTKNFPPILRPLP